MQRPSLRGRMAAVVSLQDTRLHMHIQAPQEIKTEPENGVATEIAKLTKEHRKRMIIGHAEHNKWVCSQSLPCYAVCNGVMGVAGCPDSGNCCENCWAWAADSPFFYCLYISLLLNSLDPFAGAGTETATGGALQPKRIGLGLMEQVMKVLGKWPCQHWKKDGKGEHMRPLYCRPKIKGRQGDLPGPWTLPFLFPGMCRHYEVIHARLWIYFGHYCLLMSQTQHKLIIKFVLAC